MHKRFPELVSRYPSLSARATKDAVNTAAFKVGGAEYGAILTEALPLLERILSSGGKLPHVPDYFGRPNDSDATKALLTLCGRSEAAHARGKKLYSGIGGHSAAIGNQVIVRDRAMTYLASLKAAAVKAPKAPKTAPKTDKRDKVE